MPTRMYNYEARRARPALGVGSSRPHNTLSLVSPARRNVGWDVMTAGRSNSRLMYLDRTPNQSDGGWAQAKRKASKAKQLSCATHRPSNTVQMRAFLPRLFPISHQRVKGSMKASDMLDTSMPSMPVSGNSPGLGRQAVPNITS